MKVFVLFVHLQSIVLSVNYVIHKSNFIIIFGLKVQFVPFKLIQALFDDSCVAKKLWKAEAFPLFKLALSVKLKDLPRWLISPLNYWLSALWRITAKQSEAISFWNLEYVLLYEPICLLWGKLSDVLSSSRPQVWQQWFITFFI